MEFTNILFDYKNIGRVAAGMNLAGPFKARIKRDKRNPSRQRRMSSSVADATHYEADSNAGLKRPA
jgi:hypothetical protein